MTGRSRPNRCSLPGAKNPVDIWPQWVLDLYSANQNGDRGVLLHHAGLMLKEYDQRGMVARLKAQLDERVVSTVIDGRIRVGPSLRDDYCPRGKAVI